MRDHMIPVHDAKYYVTLNCNGDVYVGGLSAPVTGLVFIAHEDVPEVLKQQLAMLDIALGRSGCSTVPGVGDIIALTGPLNTRAIYFLYKIPSLDYTEVDNYLRCSREYLT